MMSQSGFSVRDFSRVSVGLRIFFDQASCERFLKELTNLGTQSQGIASSGGSGVVLFWAVPVINWSPSSVKSSTELVSVGDGLQKEILVNSTWSTKKLYDSILPDVALELHSRLEQRMIDGLKKSFIVEKAIEESCSKGEKT